MVQFNMNVGVSICSNDCGGVAGCSGGDRYGNAIRSGGGGGAIDGGCGGCVWPLCCCCHCCCCC